MVDDAAAPAANDAGVAPEAAELARIRALADKLPSPCGKGESLAASERSGCPYAPFARRYVEMAIEDGASDEQSQVFYENRYLYRRRATFTTDDDPRLGPKDALVTVVEFFDYECPPCRQLSPVLEQLVARYPGTLAIVFKELPLPFHARARDAARAALAAAAQGKFLEMHRRMLAQPKRHDPADLRALAKELGLDLKRFRRDYDAADALIDADVVEADAADVERTPAVFINGERFGDLPSPTRYLYLAIDEALALANQ